ncbi:hypothetical protein L6R52_36035, partial [Myxococcota bacterium]|nr:hypothetical protein [Myxococcota bacterium]
GAHAPHAGRTAEAGLLRTPAQRRLLVAIIALSVLVVLLAALAARSRREEELLLVPLESVEAADAQVVSPSPDAVALPATATTSSRARP